MNAIYVGTAARHLYKKMTITNLRNRLYDLLSYLTVQNILIIASLLIILLVDVLRIFTDLTFLAPVGLIGFEIGRLLVAVLLLFLLFTEPPRSLGVRRVLGIAAFVTFLIATQSFFAYQIGLLDYVLYIEVAIIIALEALEPQVQPHHSVVRFESAES